MALAVATPMAMIVPMNDWMFSVVPVSARAATTPAITAGIAEAEIIASRSDWK